MNSENIKFDGLFLVDKYNSFSQKFKDRVNASVKKSYIKSGTEVKKQMRDQARSVFKVKKRSFLNSFSAKIYDKKKGVLPALLLGSGVDFIAMHENGGVIKPKGGLLLIPMTKKELGPKEFKRMINNLMKSGNAYFRKTKKGQWALFAKNTTKDDNDIKRISGKKKLSVRGKKETLIAIGVKQVVMKKRLHTRDIIRKNVGLITRNIQQQFDEDF